MPPSSEISLCEIAGTLANIEMAVNVMSSAMVEAVRLMGLPPVVTGTVEMAPAVLPLAVEIVGYCDAAHDHFPHVNTEVQEDLTWLCLGQKSLQGDIKDRASHEVKFHYRDHFFRLLCNWDWATCPSEGCSHKSHKGVRPKDIFVLADDMP